MLDNKGAVWGNNSEETWFGLLVSHYKVLYNWFPAPSLGISYFGAAAIVFQNGFHRTLEP